MNSSAEAFGQILGLGFCIILPLVLIILSGVSIRRRSTNTFCALAIIGSLLAVILFSFSGLGARATHVPIGVLETLILSGGALMLISTVLAIVGLVRCLTRRRHIRGRWRAVSALALNAPFLTFLTINMLHGVSQGLAVRKLMQPGAAAGSPVTNETWNFRLQPPVEWSPVDPAGFGPETRAAFGRRDPEMRALVRAEDQSESAGAPLSTPMEALKRSMSAATKVEFLHEDEKVEQHIQARTLEVRSHEMTGNVFHVIWMARGPGTLYRIEVQGPDESANRIRDEAQRIFAGFEIIDSGRHVESTSRPAGAASAAARP